MSLCSSFRRRFVLSWFRGLLRSHVQLQSYVGFFHGLQRNDDALVLVQPRCFDLLFLLGDDFLSRQCSDRRIRELY